MRLEALLSTWFSTTSYFKCKCLSRWAALLLVIMSHFLYEFLKCIYCGLTVKLSFAKYAVHFFSQNLACVFAVYLSDLACHLFVKCWGNHALGIIFDLINLSNKFLSRNHLLKKCTPGFFSRLKRHIKQILMTLHKHIGCYLP